MSTRLRLSMVGTALGLSVLLASAKPAVALELTEPLDFDHGNAPIQTVIPQVVPIIFEIVAPSDASIVLRITTIASNAWFDAIAPYHETAVGMYSRLARRPVAERTQRNKNIAILYASYQVLNSLLPAYKANWRAMLEAEGLDPSDDREDDSAIGIGNRAGKAVARAREHDGMNQLGDEGGKKYHRVPYEDYTGYQPVNTAYELRDPSRWQPAITTSGTGLFRVQHVVTPQWAFTRPYSYKNPNRFRSPPPIASWVRNYAAYRRQADEVLAASAGLTDTQKMTAELFNNKIESLGYSALYVNTAFSMSLDQFVQYDFLTNVAAFDGGIATWNEKYRWDAVRPFSAIHYIYGKRHVTAWGGPGLGTVKDMPGNEWQSYLNTADHSDYPSGSACFCAAHAQASRRFLNGDSFGWTVPFLKGSSKVEPGFAPSQDVLISFETFSDFEKNCAQSRVWGGVHFQAAVDEGRALCRPIGDLAFELVQALVAGKSRQPRGGPATD